MYKVLYEIQHEVTKMVTKKDLCAMLDITFDDPISEQEAWDAFTRFNEYITNGDSETINYFIKLITYTPKNVLELRFEMAELGYELTPSQLSQYLFVLSTCILDRAKLFKEK